MKIRLLLVLVAAGGLALRLAGAGSGLPSKSLSLRTYHPDESIVLYSVAAMNPSKLDFHPRESLDWGSLYTYTVAAALKAASLTGYVKKRERAFFEENLREADKLYLTGRAVSVLAGTASVVFIFMAGEVLLGAPAALIAALLAAVSAAPVVLSVYLKPDPLMLMFGCLAIYFSALILKGRGARACMWAGLSVGLAAASKYNGAVFILVPLTAALLARDRKFWQIPLFSAAGFLAGCPYSVITFRDFIRSFSVWVGMGTSAVPPWNYGMHEGVAGYFSYYLRYAFGWPLMTAMTLALAWPFAAGPLRKEGWKSAVPDRTAVFLLLPAAVILLLLAMSSRKMALYSAPAWPLLFLLTAKAATELFGMAGAVGRKALAALGCLLAVHAFVYTAAYVSLFTGQDTREEASAWITANIPKGGVIGLTKKYFWTPPVLRGAASGYDTLSFRDDAFNLSEGVLSLKTSAAKADYLVLSDFEIKDFLRLPVAYPAENAVLKELLDRKFSLAARFEKKPSFLGFSFTRGQPPWDWAYPDPIIYIYRKQAPQAAKGKA